MSEFIPYIPTRQEEISRIVANFLTRLRQCLGKAGSMMFGEALGKAGISVPQLQTGKGLRLDQLDRTLDFVRKRKPDIMLRLMTSLEMQDLGIMGYASLSCRTLENALSVLLKYQDLTSDRHSDDPVREGDYLRIRPVRRFHQTDNMVSIAEDSIAGNWRAVELLLGPDTDLAGAEASFAFEPPPYEAAYHEVFAPCDVQFGVEVSELRIPLEWLNRPVTSANQVMSEVTGAVCERMLGPEQNMGQDTPGAVRRLLISRPGQKMLRMEEAAEELLMSSAKMRKRLYRSGTSYKQIVLEVRMTLASHYLETTPLTVQEIAFLLDYSQPGPFSRAFKNFYGVPPRDARVIESTTS